MLKRVDHVNVVVNDLCAAVSFFKLLGFKEGDSSKLEGEWISKIVGLENVSADYVSLGIEGAETTVELIKYYSPQIDNQQNQNSANLQGIRHIAFAVDDIESVMERLSNNNVDFFSEIIKYPKTGKKLVYFYGPEGIILELAQYS